MGNLLRFSRAPESFRSAVCLGGIVLILTIPSLVCLSTLPALWRDSDAFYQVASKPSVLTVLHWPPLYCFGARVWIYLGALVSGTGADFTLQKPIFSDASLFWLLLGQHAGLIAAECLACVSISRKASLRLGAAGVFALNPAFAVFANCVGSEALSNIVVLLVAVQGLRTLKRPSRRRLVWYCLLLLCAICTRHINVLLALLLPLASLLGWLAGWLRGQERPPSGKFSKQFLLFAGSAALTVCFAQTVVWSVARMAKVPYRSRFGYAFQWRLNYLLHLTDIQRNVALDQAAAALPDQFTREALGDLRQRFDDHANWNPETLALALDHHLATEGFPLGTRRGLEMDRRLNALSVYFLRSGDAGLYGAIWRDFLDGLHYSPASVSREPFATTDWLAQRIAQPEFAAIQHLQSFAHTDWEKRWRRSWYFTLWSFFPLWGFSAIVLGVTGLSWLAQRPVQTRQALYPLTLVLTGFILFLANCCLTFLGARFLLPTYELFLWAALLATAQLLNDEPALTPEVVGVVPAVCD